GAAAGAARPASYPRDARSVNLRTVSPRAELTCRRSFPSLRAAGEGMSEADRPDGSKERRARLRVFRGGRARAGRAQPASPREVARRLSALERRVEEALGSGGQLAARDRLRAAFDQALAATAG